MKNWFKYLKHNSDAFATTLSLLLVFIALPVYIYFSCNIGGFCLYVIVAFFAIFAVAISAEDWIKEYKQFLLNKNN